MRALGHRGWRRRRDRGGEAAIGSVDRRAMLIGAAATAGVVATAGPGAGAVASPLTSGASSATALGGGPLVAASDVSVVPTGEIIETDAQSAFEALDRRLSKAHLIDDLQVAMTLVDDFMGSNAATGRIGELGWGLGFGATGTAAVGVIVNEPGLFTIGTGTTATGWQNLNLGNNNLLGSPVLMMEWRLRVSAASNATNAYSCWFGLHNNLAGAEPTTGLYFRHTPADGGTWQAVCANLGSLTVVSTTKVVDASFHRFRITSDGGGIARFYIDSTLMATITSSLPTTNRHTPCVSIRKSAGTTERAAVVDYFALRFEHPR